jgi:hypothetical protein
MVGLAEASKCRGLCQESMSAQTCMACPNATCPHGRQRFGLCRDQRWHHSSDRAGERKSTVAGERNDDVRALGNSARERELLILPRTPCVYAAVGTVAGGARDKERLGMIIMIVVHAVVAVSPCGR